MAISDRELWACAAHILRQYGDRAPAHIAERIADLALKSDTDGVTTWKQIADRYDRLVLSEIPPQ